MASSSAARASENQSMSDMNAFGKEVKSVVEAGPGWTEVELNDGTIEHRTGDRASRNNNPGNIEASDWTQKQPGYVGTDGRFAVFDSVENGKGAIGNLLGTDRYANTTVGGAIRSYAPPSENNSTAYAKSVADRIGVSVNTPMSDLTPAQRSAMVDAITGVEGNTGYKTETKVAGNWGSTQTAGAGPATAGTGPTTPTPDVPTPSPAPRGTEAAAGGTVTTPAAPPGTQGFPATPPAQPQAPGFPSFATPATDYQRTGLATALGLGIDAVASIAGGPVSLAAQGGAFLLTGDSIGGTIVDMAGGKYGPNQYAPGADDKYSGDRAGGAGSGKQNTTGVNKPETISKTPTVKPGETTTDETKLPYEEAFVAKYIDRPSAAERWGKLTKVSDYVT
jgi:hypothetical protein